MYMKRHILLLAALVATMCGAQAQTWTGETVADGGKYYIINDKQLGHNVYLKADATGYTVTDNAAEATLFTFTASSGKYKVSYGENYLGENSGNQSTTTQTEYQLNSQDGGYYNFKAADGTSNHRYLDVSTAGVYFPKSATQAQSSEWWKLGSETSMAAYNDCGGYIRNAKANYGPEYFWTVENTGIGLAHTISNTFGKLFELIGDWNQSAAFSSKMSQTLTNLPVGRYRLSADMMAAEATTMTLTAGDQTVTMQGTGDGQGLKTVSVDATVGSDGRLTVSCMAENDGQTNHQWSNVTNFSLISLGNLTPATVNQQNAYLYTTIDGREVALGRGATWGTRATLDNEKVRRVNISGQGVTTIQYEANKNLFITNDAAAYTDGTSNCHFFFVAQTDGGYKIYLESDITKALGHTTVTTEKDKTQDREVPVGDQNGDGTVLTRTVVAPVAAADADIFFIGTEQATLKSHAQTYGTFYAPFAIQLPEGITASTCEGLVEGSSSTLALGAEVNSVDACQAVITKSTLDEDFTRVYYGMAASEPTYTTGLLTGVNADAQVENGKFVLQNQQGVVGFYEVQDGTTVTLTKNHCYLTAPAGGQGVKAFTFATATGIESVNGQPSTVNGPVYNLQGQRVSRATRGLYIINGKKVIK